MATYQLTPNKLLILAAIRHLQPCQVKQVACLLSYSIGAIVIYLHGENGHPGLIERGYVAHTPAKHGDFRLSEAGAQAIQDICLIKENGCYSVGEVIRRYDQDEVARRGQVIK